MQLDSPCKVQRFAATTIKTQLRLARRRPPLLSMLLFLAAPPLRRGHLAAVVIGTCLLSGCGLFSAGQAPAPKEAAHLDIALSASPELNPDSKGRASPLLVRVYELKSDTLFLEADYFSLQNADKTTLAGDLLAVDQFVMRPGEAREVRRRAHPDTTAIGVLAGYRDLPHAVWRTVHKMPPAPDASWVRAVIPAYTAKLRIDLQPNAIGLTDLGTGRRTTQTVAESAPTSPKPAEGMRGADLKDILPPMPDAKLPGATQLDQSVGGAPRRALPSQ